MTDFFSRLDVPERYQGLKRLLKDMGDGSYAEVIYVGDGSVTSTDPGLAAARAGTTFCQKANKGERK